MLNLRLRGVPLAAIPQAASVSPARFDRPMHVFYCICDHFEPRWRGHASEGSATFGAAPLRHVQDARVHRWVHEYPQVVDPFRDSIGRRPQHTFFYPGDEYDAEHVDQIADLCRKGYGDVEVHLHHDRDTSESLRETLNWFLETLHNRHGLLRKDEEGRIQYGFIHGNWALDNSRPDGCHCGVNDELTILRETGCYADFTLPSAPSPCQTTTINRIYYAIDDPHRPRSHETGIRAGVGRKRPDNGLLMIQGPLAFDLSSRKWGLLPRLENSDVSVNRPPTVNRFRLWAGAGVCVEGREDWVFVKVYTHGAQDPTTEMFLGPQAQRFHAGLRDLADTHPAFHYYYVTAWEMAQLVHLAERGGIDPREALEGSRTAGAVGCLADTMCR